MSKLVPIRPELALNEQAAFWMAKLHRGDLSNSEKRELSQWLKEHPDHPTALRNMAALWEEADCLQVLAELFPEESDSAPIASEAVPHTSNLARFAAVILVTVAVSYAFLFGNGEPTTPNQSTADAAIKLEYSTGLGDQSLAELQDGSRMTLNTNTDVTVQFSADERRVELLQGEALFQVVRDEKRPFIVRAGNGEVRALGTAFNVRINQGRVKVLVTEGVVQVSTKSNARSQEQSTSTLPSELLVTLETNGSVEYDQAIEKSRYLPAKTAERQIAWTSGKLIFDGEPLEEVILELARYTNKPIQFTDPDIGQLRVGGYFDLANLDPMLETLALSFNLQVLHTDDGAIMLSHKEASKTDQTH